MFDFLRITKALADENRLRALMALNGRELCVCQIIELLELAPSTVSKHMSILRQARLVSGRKKGRWMYYRLADRDAPAEVKEAIAWVRTSLDGSARVRQDASRLEQILETHKEVLCQKYHKR
jgi:ArsR family transcriptional regulator